MLNKKGNVPLIFMIFLFFMALGVVGIDFSRAHAIRARLQTACDAATLAACQQANIVPIYKTEMYDANGNITNDPSTAVSVQSKIVGYHSDLSSNAAEAQKAADEAFIKNLQGVDIPLKSVILPQNIAINSSDIHNLPDLSISEGIDYNNPDVVNGIPYYDKYYFNATVGVRSFLYSGVFKNWIGGVKQSDTQARNYVLIGAKSESQALSPKNSQQTN
ncbi:Tad domain-containing protein [Thermoanaerobacterium thermosaccharolyticum]|uniref:Tad domain-containing protein n=1 Tax=Thermoanaerobacterium thermosaccharolyticum TaxID=1517 RepID=UPI003D287910